MLQEKKKRKLNEWVMDDKNYFESYENISIHEAMLKDQVRTQAYEDAITDHAFLFKDKTVIDVGCGTGILSIFCAKAGAKKVYAIEASNMAANAKQIVKDNNLSDVIEVVHARVEDCNLETPTGEQVVADIIVSEWMGYFLLYESMFDSVLAARDKWLHKDGHMFPSHCAIYLTPITDDNWFTEKILYWNNVYGVDMTALLPAAKKTFFSAPIVDVVDPLQCLSFAKIIKFIDCKTCTLEEVQKYEAAFDFQFTMAGNFHGFVSFFDTYFCPKYDEGKQPEVTPLYVPTDTHTTCVNNISVPSLSQPSTELLTRLCSRHPLEIHKLSTSPDSEPTHWSQTIFFTGDNIPVEQDDKVCGKICVSQDKELCNRYLNIKLHWTLNTSITKADGEGADMQFSHEEDNPPQNTAFKHSKTFSLQ